LFSCKGAHSEGIKLFTGDIGNKKGVKKGIKKEVKMA